MLGKLLKHEFKATARTMLPMFGVVVLLSVLANLGFAQIADSENGALDIPSSALIALARFYKVSVDYLLDLTNDRTQRWK